MHPDTRSNLALLDIAGGHFSRIEFASEGSLPGSLIAEFAYIAREYVNESTSQSLDLGGSLHPQRSHGDGMSSLDLPEVPGSADRSMNKLDKGTDVILVSYQSSFAHYHANRRLAPHDSGDKSGHCLHELGSVFYPSRFMDGRK